MPFKRVVVSICFSLVPVLGLTSCSKDAHQGDTWEMKEPVIEAGTASYPVSSADHRTLPVTSVMKFSGASWANLKVASTCHSGSREFTDSFSLNYRPSLPIKSLWPRTMTAELSDVELRASECSFKFLASSDLGSTHEFAVAGVALEHFVEPKLDSFMQQSVRQTSTARVDGGRGDFVGKFETLVSAIELLISADEAKNSVFTTMTLICGEHRASLPVSIDARAMASSFVTQLQLSGVRYCRLSAARTDADTNVFAMTTEAAIRFTRTLLNVSTTPTFKAVVREKSLFQINLVNSSDEDAFVDLPSGPLPIRFREVTIGARYTRGLLVSIKSIDDQNEFRLENLSFVSHKEASDIYRISPHASAKIEVQLPSTWSDCYSPSFSGEVVQIAGLKFGFLKAFEIHQFDSETEASGVTLYSAPLSTNQQSLPMSVLDPVFADQFGPTVPESTQVAQSASGRCF